MSGVNIIIICVFIVYTQGQFCSCLTVDKQTCIDAGCNDNGTARCTLDSINSTNCICYPGYMSDKCTDRNECEHHNLCGSGICVNTIGSFRCVCLPGKTGDHCNTNDTNFTCTLGYREDNNDTCVDIDECTYISSVSPCSRGKCINTPGSYMCDCPAGWTGNRCSTDIPECDSNPCLHGNCTNLRGSFTCQCDAMWTGSLCDTSLTTTQTSQQTLVPSTNLVQSTPIIQSASFTRISTLTNLSTTGTPTLKICTNITTNVTKPCDPTSLPSNAAGRPSQTGHQTTIPIPLQITTTSTVLGQLAATSRDYTTSHTDEPLDVGLIAGCVVGGVMVVAVGVIVTVAVYQLIIKRRHGIDPDQNTVIEVEQQTTDNGEPLSGKSPGQIVGIPQNAGYAMRTRFSIQRLFR